MAKVEFNYQGQIINVQCNEKDKMDNILRKFCIKVKKNVEDLNFIYSGNFVNHNFDFISIANSIDKQRKIISIVVTDNNSKDNNSELIKEIKELKEKWIKANKTIDEKNAEIEELKYKITMIKSESMNQVNNLLDSIEKKDEQIKSLKKELETLNKADKMSVTIISNDQRVIYSVPCNPDTIFSEVEEKLYKSYPEYRESQNTFLFKGNLILRYKTISENKIKSGDTVMLMKLE